MKLERAAAIIAAAESLGYEVLIRPEYSGRDMEDRTTVAVAFDAPDWCAIIHTIAHATSEDEWPGDFADDVKGLQWDLSGRGIVIY